MNCSDNRRAPLMSAARWYSFEAWRPATGQWVVVQFKTRDAPVRERVLQWRLEVWAYSDGDETRCCKLWELPGFEWAYWTPIEMPPSFQKHNFNCAFQGELRGFRQ